jgi:hypothetical protein
MISPDGVYVPSPCTEDFVKFKDFLRDSRKNDDYLLLNLNKTDGSPEQCQVIWKQLSEIYLFRENRLNMCIHDVEKETDPQNTLYEKQKLSFLRSEFGVEKIQRGDTIKQFRNKCRGFNPTYQ